MHHVWRPFASHLQKFQVVTEEAVFQGHVWCSPLCHHAMHYAVFFSPQSFVPHAHTGQPMGMAVSHCIIRYETMLILATCQIRHHHVLDLLVIVELESCEL